MYFELFLISIRNERCNEALNKSFVRLNVESNAAELLDVAEVYVSAKHACVLAELEKRPRFCLARSTQALLVAEFVETLFPGCQIDLDWLAVVHFSGWCFYFAKSQRSDTRLSKKTALTQLQRRAV